MKFLLPILLAGLVAGPGVAQTPQTREATSPAPARREARRIPRRMSEAKRQQMLTFVQENLPAMSEHLSRLKEDDEGEYRRALRRIGPRIKRVMNMPPEPRQLHIEQIELRVEIVQTAMAYRQTGDEEEKQKQLEALEQLLVRQFELEQKRRRLRLEHLEQQLQTLKEQLHDRAEQKDRIVAEHLQRTLKVVEHLDNATPREKP